MQHGKNKMFIESPNNGHDARTYGQEARICVRARLDTRANSDIKAFMSALMYMKFRFYETLIK